MIDKKIKDFAYKQLLLIDKNPSNEFISFNFSFERNLYAASAYWNGYSWVLFEINLS